MPNHQKIRRALLTSIISAGIVLTIPASSHADEKEIPVIGTAKASRDKYGDSFIEINEAKRANGSKFVTVTWTLRARSDTSFNAAKFKNTLYPYDDESVSSVAVIDEDSKFLYHPLQDSTEFCLCTGNFYPHDFVKILQPDASVTYWNSYMIPEETTEITLQVPGFEPAKGIPIE